VGRWFSALSPSLRHDIFRLGTVTRYAHGDLIVEQGELAQHWFACASGAIRFRRTSPAGKLVTLAYVEPGKQHTPMMQQYLGLKAAYPDTLLFTAWAIFTRCFGRMPKRPPACSTSP
jgi:hypothetical protein